MRNTSTLVIILLLLVAIAIGLVAIVQNSNSGDTERRVEVLKSNKQGDPHANKYDFGTDPDDDGDTIPTEDDEVEGSEEVAEEEPAAIGGTKWAWVRTVYNNDDIVEPDDSDEFLATFSAEGQFSSSTDCNSMTGSYELDGNQITFGPLAATKMACLEENLEGEYTEMIGQVQSYFVNDQGQLILELKLDTGSMIFEPYTESEGGNAPNLMLQGNI